MNRQLVADEGATGSRSDGLAPSSKRMLITDDEDFVRFVIAEMAVHCGWEVLCACSGKEALDVLAKHGEGIALALVDLGMPEMDGLTLLAEMKETHPHIPAILTTGYSEQDISSQLQAVSAYSVLPKPFNMMELKRLLDLACPGSAVESPRELALG